MATLLIHHWNRCNFAFIMWMPKQKTSQHDTMTKIWTEISQKLNHGKYDFIPELFFLLLYRSYFYLFFPVIFWLCAPFFTFYAATPASYMMHATNSCTYTKRGRAVTQRLSYRREGPARNQRADNPITYTCGNLDPLLSSASEGLAWTDDGNSSSPNPHTPPTSPPGTLAETRGYDYKHHLFSRLTYPGLYSSPLKTKWTSIRAPAAEIAENAQSHTPRPVRQVLMCTSVQNRGFISMYLSGRLQWSRDKIFLFFFFFSKSYHSPYGVLWLRQDVISM